MAPEPLRHVVHGSAGEPEDVDPELVIVVVERGYGSVVRDHLTAHPVTVEPTSTAEPSEAAALAVGLDPSSMLGLDVDVAALAGGRRVDGAADPGR